MPAEVCTDWRDWESKQIEHPAFHYWRAIDDKGIQRSDRLGERLYIVSCLLWSSLHDHFLGRKFHETFPNWSAICSYYSMVHALRLFWFAAYGSYPTGHSEMAESLTLEGRGAIANWQKRELGQGTRIQVAAFQGLMRDVFGSHTLGDKLHLVGDAFRHSKELRNDSNYESLVLAHQYWHDPGVFDNPVNVDQEFALATEALSKVSASVLQFVVTFLQKSLLESTWIAANSHFDSQALYWLVLMYVRDKIGRYAETSSDGSATISEWCGGFGSLSEDVECANDEKVGAAISLKKFIAYGLFNVKRSILIGFQHKADNLMQAALSLDPRPSLPRSLDEAYQLGMSQWTNIGGRFDSTARGVSWIMDADESDLRPRVFIRFGTMGVISIARKRGESESLLDTYRSKLMDSPAMATSVAQGKWSLAYQDVNANDLQIILGAVMWLAEQMKKGI